LCRRRHRAHLRGDRRGGPARPGYPGPRLPLPPRGHHAGAPPGGHRSGEAAAPGEGQGDRVGFPPPLNKRFLLRQVSHSLDRLESVNNFTEFVKAFSQFGAEMVELAHLTGDRQNDLKDERRRAQMAAARQVLERSTMMLLTSSKVSVGGRSSGSNRFDWSDLSEAPGLQLVEGEPRHGVLSDEEGDGSDTFRRQGWRVEFGRLELSAHPRRGIRERQGERLLLHEAPPTSSGAEQSHNG
jgi:hypothetical protein